MLNTSVRLGRIAGIEIGVNWSWFPIFFLIAWTLAIVVFPDQNPGLADGTYWAMGVVAALLLFVSILLHELGHAVQARRDDVGIDGITLWLFGGVARFRDLYATPGAEFRIAIAGPLVTAAIIVALVAIASGLALGSAVDGVVFWLAYINLLVLGFNLLPALPLDGGRILHAGLWRLRNDLSWATRVGASIGVAFGYLMIGGGIVLFFAAAAFGGLWLALIGWFLATAARAEATQLVAREALRGATVAELMSRDPVTVEPELTIGRFIDEVARGTRYASYPVVESGEPIGLLTFKDVTAAPRPGWDSDSVRDHMLPREQVPVVRPTDDAAEVFTKLIGEEVRRALVVEDGGLAGLLSITDLARAVEVGSMTGLADPGSLRGLGRR